jgi:hypothetical protein
VRSTRSSSTGTGHIGYWRSLITSGVALMPATLNRAFVTSSTRAEEPLTPVGTSRVHDRRVVKRADGIRRPPPVTSGPIPFPGNHHHQVLIPGMSSRRYRDTRIQRTGGSSQA